MPSRILTFFIEPHYPRSKHISTVSFPLDFPINKGFTNFMTINHTIKTSNLPSYLDVLEISFSQFLEKEGTSVKTRKNYKSDLRQFLKWSVSVLDSLIGVAPLSHKEFVQAITADIVTKYRAYLLQYRVPPATINRRLSTLRSFFRFCLAQNWITTNPSSSLTSATLRTAPSPNNSHQTKEDILQEFGTHLREEGASKSTIKNYVADVRQFLFWKTKTS